MTRPHTRCDHCGYDLRGLVPQPPGNVVCPECGAPATKSPRPRPACTMPGFGRVALLNTTLAGTWLLIAQLLFRDRLVAWLLTVLGLLALVPLIGAVVFARAWRLGRPRVDAWEELILCAMITGFFSLLATGML